MDGLLQARRVTKMFGGLAAVSLVDFDLREGEILGLIGPNGSGKTTLVNVITGMITYSDGEVLFRGRSIRGLPPYEIGRLGVSRTFQIVKPFRNLTVLQNVMVGALFGARGGARNLAAAQRQAEEVLEFVGLAHRARSAAEGLNVPERKRMELARSLAMRPTLLFLDEVMAGLNAAEIDEAVELIKRIRGRGITLVVIEHVMKAIRKLSDRIMVLFHGEKLTEGSPEEVLNNPEVVSAYLGRRYAEQAGA
jgi:branched-chain amino acid transport system ATP-binding protein